jgi:hypothetical protein
VIARERFTSRAQSWRQRFGAQPRRLLLQDETAAALALGDATAWRACVQVTIDVGVFIGGELPIDVRGQTVDGALAVALHNSTLETHNS